MEVKAELFKPYTEEQRLDFIVEYNHQLGYEIKETETSLQAWGLTDEEQAAVREADFKSKFFYINGYGWYRKQPKGYQSAVESMDVLFNVANVMDGIQAGLIIFYQQPDFTKPEQCTEEWLVEHQILQAAMTKVEFMQLYVAFITAWNTEEHKNSLEAIGL